MSQFTVVIGVDEHTSHYLLTTLPTWRKIRPELFTVPWLVFRDKNFAGIETVKHAINNPDARYIAWEPDDYPSQREKMLSGHLYAAAYEVETPYALKIDCDAVAVTNKPLYKIPDADKWPRPEWFEPDDNGVGNVMIGSAWPYTRAKPDSRLEVLLDWIEILESFGDKYYETPRLNLKDKIGKYDHPRGPWCKHTRMASWLCFQHVWFMKQLADRCTETYGVGKLPVPSHDTTAWYMAERGNYRLTYAKMTRYGWLNRMSLKGCRNESNKVLTGGYDVA